LKDITAFELAIMKTNITLLSQSRELFGVTIRQETKTGFLNLSDLQAAYNKAKAEHGWIHRDVNHVIGFKDNLERIFYVLQKQGFINCSLEQFTADAEEQGLVKTLKTFGVYKTTGRAEQRTTYCNAYIWVLIAMEMNPLLYGSVVVWLTDRLVLNRLEAGDMYKDLSKAVAQFPNADFSALAKTINNLVFGRHEYGIRNTGTEEQLKELHKIESNLAFSIDSGFITSFPSLMEHIWEMRKKKDLHNRTHFVS